MSATPTFERIAALLPEEQRQRFLLMCARFRNVPEDDEILLIVEAICFTTLIWKTVPDEIEKLLKESAPLKADYKCLDEIVKQAVNETVLSYEDLKLICQRLESHETALKKMTSTDKIVSEHKQREIPLRVALVAIGILTGYIVIPTFIQLLM